MEEKEKEKCGCGDDHHHHEVSTDDIARHNHFMLNAIVKVLIDKKVIASDDINKAVADLQKMMQEKAK